MYDIRTHCPALPHDISIFKNPEIVNDHYYFNEREMHPFAHFALVFNDQFNNYIDTLTPEQLKELYKYFKKVNFLVTSAKKKSKDEMRRSCTANWCSIGLPLPLLAFSYTFEGSSNLAESMPAYYTGLTCVSWYFFLIARCYLKKYFFYQYALPIKNEMQLLQQEISRACNLIGSKLSAEAPDLV